MTNYFRLYLEWGTDGLCLSKCATRSDPGSVRHVFVVPTLYEDLRFQIFGPVLYLPYKSKQCALTYLNFIHCT